MAFDGILGQDRAAGQLTSALARDRVGHAYLFAGPDGVGKTLLATAFAKALLCPVPDAPHDASCLVCRRVGDGQHPDLLLVAAPDERRFIMIDQVRDLCRQVALRPVEAARRIAVLREADRMNEEAANALLKTLEEPPAQTVLILTTARPRNLLPTIRSRCIEVRCAPLSSDDILAILARQGKGAAPVERLAARTAQGSVGRALDALASGCLDLHLRLLDRVLDLPKSDPLDLANEIAEWLAATGAKKEVQRDLFRESLRLLSCLYRDLLLLRMHGDRGHLFHAENADRMAALAERLPPVRLNAILDAIALARVQTDRNAAADLVIQELWLRVAELQRAA